MADDRQKELSHSQGKSTAVYTLLLWILCSHLEVCNFADQVLLRSVYNYRLKHLSTLCLVLHASIAPTSQNRRFRAIPQREQHYFIHSWILHSHESWSE